MRTRCGHDRCVRAAAGGRGRRERLGRPEPDPLRLCLRHACLSGGVGVRDNARMKNELAGDETVWLMATVGRGMASFAQVHPGHV